MFCQSKALRIALIKCDVGQKDLSEKMKVTKQTVSSWMTGKTDLSTSRINEICEILNIEVSEFIKLGE